MATESLILLKETAFFQVPRRFQVVSSESKIRTLMFEVLLSGVCFLMGLVVRVSFKPSGIILVQRL